MNKINIKALIYIIRGQKVMLDRDLAALYGVKTKRLNEVVKRNMKRFEGDDFMFRLTKDEAEYASLRSQIATSNSGRGGTRYLPYAFTELGVAMLSSVLTSETAININRDIMRAFVTFNHLTVQPLPDDNSVLRAEIQVLRDQMNEILADQNDINETTRAQLDAISSALAELQSDRARHTGCTPIGFNVPKQ
ncbi:MAG: ORF6N domain-containing protein [Bacteroidaceae bacterium]|nr:ORF6N domain-containing protein [Bacteroidaceae bacterium]